MPSHIDEVVKEAQKHMRTAGDTSNSSDTVYWVGEAQLAVSLAVLKELVAIRTVLERQAK